MMRKVIKYEGICEIVLGLILFVALNIQFSKDPVVIAMLGSNTAMSALHRLVIYFVPGTMILCPLFMVVFDSKPLLLFMSLLNILSSVLLFVYSGESIFIYVSAIISSILSTIYILIVLTVIIKKIKSL